MALINCPECSTEISDSAVTCVKCGIPITTPTKTSSSGAIITSLIMAVVGIGLLIHGNSLNVEAQQFFLGFGEENPGTPWMIFGAVMLGICGIIIVKKIFVDNK